MDEEVIPITKSILNAITSFAGKAKTVAQAAGEVAGDMKGSGGISQGPLGKAYRGIGRVGSRGADAAAPMGRFSLKVGNAMTGPNLKYYALGAGALGVASAHPFRGAIGGMNDATFGIGSNFAARSPVDATLQQEHNQAMESSYSYLLNQDESDISVPRSSITGPSGDIVFGLHNLRA